MTLVVCFKTIGGIVLAADSRGTIGDPRGLTAINDSQVKIHQIGKCGLAIAGASEMGAVLIDELHKQNGIENFQDIDTAIETIITNFSNNFNKWFQGIHPAQRQGVLFTVAGYRNAQGDNPPMPVIYVLNSQMNFAPQLYETSPCLVGVPQYAVYLVHRYYDPSISLQKGIAFAHYLIDETASQDPKVGGKIRIAVITPGDGYRELPEKEVETITPSNQELNLQLREFFLKGEVT